ncbi:MAG TPA: hypothetical protein VFV20_11295, partial [Candidatus Limnocylindria bacterium]|nr:hypothetical protein [Candidatus Limnocylindria bacterium]
REQGVHVSRGDPSAEQPGASIVIPDHPSRLRPRDLDLDDLRRSYVRQLAERGARRLTADETAYVAAETRWTPDRIAREWDAIAATSGTR